MAVVMMGGEEKNPTFHDFLGMSCEESPIPNKGCEAEGDMEAEASVGVSSGGHGIVSASSDLGSERQGANNSEVFNFHGRKNAISGPEASNTFSGRKRSNPLSYLSLVRDKMLPIGSDSLENSRLMKMVGKEVVSERVGRSRDDEMFYSMQPPLRPSSSLIVHPPSTRPDSLISRWERSLPMNPGLMAHCPSRFGQSGMHMEKLSSSYTYKDTNVGATLISQAAADEGSRTGMKGSGILKMINSSSSGAGETHTTGMLPYSNRPKAPQISEPEPPLSHHRMAPVSRQMTIFYAGQAHVFDDVHPNKADIIMALAGSNGGSWSTTYSPMSGVRSPVGESKVPSRENEVRASMIAGISDHGLMSQVARIPLSSDLPSRTPGANQIGKAVRDVRVATPLAGPDTDGKRDV